MSMHRFGGRWTESKLSALREYLVSYTQALKHKPFTLHYFDAFAGSGTFVATKDSESKERRGSAQIALEVGGFHRYTFIEMSAKRCRSLQAFIDGYRIQGARVLEGDANEHLVRLCRETDWKSSRAVLFLDPYGMQVEWATLEAVARTGAIDVWYLFPLSGVTRQLAKAEHKLDDDKRRSLTRVFGTSGWMQAFYDQSPVPDLFGDVTVERHADSHAIAGWVTERLRLLFPTVEGPLLLRKSKAGKPSSGPALFALYFLMASPSPKAAALAKRISAGVVAKLRRDGAIA